VNYQATISTLDKRVYKDAINNLEKKNLAVQTSVERAEEQIVNAIVMEASAFNAIYNAIPRKASWVMI